MSMIKAIQRKTASSEKGAKGLVKGIIACAFQNLAFMLPTSLLYFLVADMMDGGVTGGNGLIGLMRVQVAPQADDDEDTEKDDFRHGMLNDHRNLRRRAPSGREEERTSCFTPCCVWSPEKTKKTLRQHVP